MNVHHPCDYRAQRSSKMTHRWLDRCVSHLEKLPVKYGYDQAFFPLYKEAVTKTYASNQRNIANSNQVANAIEDFQLGEPAEEMYAMTEVVCEILQKNSVI
jgi:queuine tRNA-ribosyltransferase